MASTTGPTVLRARDVSVAYRLQRPLRRGPSEGAERRSFVALSGVSLELRAGDALGVLGQNGAGKSTLMAALAGLVPLTSGWVHAIARPRHMGVGSVVNGLWTGRQSIRVALAALGVPASEEVAIEDDIAEFSRLGAFIDRPVRTYSRGMRNRLLFGINTAIPAGILIADEALGGADRRSRQEAESRLSRLLEGSGALVIVSHDRGTIERLCTHCILLQSGRVVDSGRPGELLARLDD